MATTLGLTGRYLYL